jgi:hypothetical protein
MKTPSTAANESKGGPHGNNIGVDCDAATHAARLSSMQDLAIFGHVPTGVCFAGLA